MPSSPISPCPSCPPHAAGGHGCAVYSSSVTDAEWAILEPLLPAPGSTAGRGGRPEKHCRRVIVDAILYIVRGGIAWRQLPVEFPPAGTVYAVFARWARSGAWQRILDALRDRLRVRAGRDRCPTAAIIDSQTVPAADTVPRSSRGWDGAKRTNGVKRHLAVDVNGLLLAVVVTAASIQDRDAAHRLLAALRGSFSTIAAGLGRRRLPRTVAHLGERRSHPYYADHQTHPRRHWFPRPAPHLGGREKFRVDQQAPPLRARLRNQTRPPRSHGPPRHDHDHDQATRPNLTVFKHPLIAQPVAELQKHQPQIALHRLRRTPDPRIEERHKRGEERRIVQQRVHPGQLLGQPPHLLGQQRLPQRALIAYSTKHDGLNPFLHKGFEAILPVQHRQPADQRADFSGRSS